MGSGGGEKKFKFSFKKFLKCAGRKDDLDHLPYRPPPPRSHAPPHRRQYEYPQRLRIVTYNTSML